MKKVSFLTPVSVILVFLLIFTGCKSAPKEKDIWSLLEDGDENAKGYFLGEVDVNAVDSHGRTPLHYAALRGDAMLANFFIAAGANVDAVDNSNQSPLGICIDNNDPVTAAVIAKAGANIHLSIQYFESTASLALKKGGQIFNSILTSANIESADSSGKTVLHLASIEGNVQAVTDIMAKYTAVSTSLNKKDDSDKNALDYALGRADSKKHMETAEQLILQGAYSDNEIFNFLAPAVRSANYNIRRNEGLTPVHYAVIDNYYGLITFLLDKGVDLNIKSTSGATALHEAVRNGNIDIISLLLNRGADVNAKDAKGNTPLHTGIPAEVHREVVTMLLSKNADFNVRDEHGDTPLHIAIILNRPADVIQAILNGGADVHIRNIEGKTPLYIAVQEVRTSIIPILLSYGSEIFAADNSGTTPFDIASRAGNNTFNLLITSETVNQRDSAGNTMLHVAVWNRTGPEHIGRILDQRAPVDARNREGETALHIAVRMNQKENGEFLISRAANIFALNGSGNSPLFLALSSSPMREWFLNSNTLIAKDGLGNSILHYAAEWNINHAIPVIIRHGISVEETNATGQTPIFMAIRTDSTSTIRILLENNASLNARDGQGNSVLHAAVRWNAQNSASFLISSGIDINAHSLNGNTPLHDAIALGMSDIETLLIRQGANLESRNMDGNTPLMEAVRGSIFHSVEKLLYFGADPLTRNSRGDTPLHTAVSMENFDLVNLLLRMGTSIHARNTRNRTPFQISMSVSPRMVSAMLSTDRIAISDDMGNSPLHIALQERASIDIIRTITQLGARINAVDSNGKTPLRIAIDMESWESAKIIADAGSDPFITAVDSKTPAEVSFSKGTDCLRALFSGRAIDSKDSAGNTILHIAARFGSPESINVLLDLGANRTIRNIASETPFEIAVRWNKRDNAELLR